MLPCFREQKVCGRKRIIVNIPSGRLLKPLDKLESPQFRRRVKNVLPEKDSFEKAERCLVVKRAKKRIISSSHF